MSGGFGKAEALNIMKINVTRIPEEGFDFDFSEKDAWLQEKLHHTLADIHRKEDKITGHFRIERIMNNVQVEARMHLPIHAVCDRCAKTYDYEIDVMSHRLMAPLFESKRQKKHEQKLEVEVTQDDLQFSYFKGDEVDVGDIIIEQAVLDQPMTYLCKNDCKGLCLQCGINLNEKSCSCSQKKEKDSPFAALKNWGKKK